MTLMGITGGIGSGKSVVAQIFKSMEIPVYHADEIAKKISNYSKKIREKLSNRFGNDIYKGDVLDKSLLSSLIFNNLKHLSFVSSVIHPEVLNNFLFWKYKYRESPFAAIETAILFESAFDEQVDVSINVFAPKTLRIQRVQARSGWNKQVILSRISNQLSDKERARRANYVLFNDCRQALLPQVESLLRELRFPH